MPRQADTGAAERSEHTQKIEQADEKKPQVADAIRHVGPTLESNPRQPYILETDQALYEPRTEAERDLGGSATESGNEQVPGHEEPRRSEALHTRLPGDTSSDPHTDVGPDNATAVQKRPSR